MMKRLQGRSLAHPGCLVGVTTGLTLGIILAAILALHNMALSAVLLIWLGLTLALGAIGWVIGDRLTPHFSAPDNPATGSDTTGES